MTIGPSYSSPWLPPSIITVGPLPLRITASGIAVAPQASSSGECGTIRNPTCFPGLSMSTVVKALEERGIVVFTT
jgi:hypothetical protein